MTERGTIFATVSTLCFVSLLLFGPIILTGQAQQLPPEVIKWADMVLYNGSVLTMDHDKPPFTVTKAVAVRDGRILAVGENDYILRLAGPNTQKLDLKGKAVLPGFIDTHTHPNRYALTHYREEVIPAYLNSLRENRVRFISLKWDDKGAALAELKKFSEGISPGEWIYSTSSGNPVAVNEISRYDVDKVAPNSPFYLKIGNAQFGVINTKMLDLLKQTYGENLAGIVKDEQGVPTGRLLPTAGTVMDQEMMPQMPPEVMASAFKKELDEWVALGVTTLSTRLRGVEVTAYGNLDRKGQLPLRMAYTHEIGRWNPFFERDIKRLGLLEGHGTDRFWLVGITVGIPDGVPNIGGPTAGGDLCSTLEKQQVLPGDTFPKGMCYWDQSGDPSRQTIITANKYGYRIAGVHTFGDKGDQMMLDAIDQASRDNPVQGRRFALDHGMMISPEVIAKSAKVGAIWSLQPQMFYGGTAATVGRMYGEEIGHRWVLPVKSLIDAGVRVTYGADTHNDPQRSPLFGLEVFVTRKTEDGRIWGSREKIDRSTGLLMMTRWAAEYVLREKELGSIEAGKLADLVILDKDPLSSAVQDEALSDIKVLTAIIGGKVVYGSLNLP
ncbi:MAG: amidohydrolase family protein [Acidobacteria bacterium]|nr:amidohydrolase family protein [Acidobacteriota bacterium]